MKLLILRLKRIEILIIVLLMGVLFFGCVKDGGGDNSLRREGGSGKNSRPYKRDASVFGDVKGRALYAPYISGKKRLGFAVDIETCREVLNLVDSRFVDGVEPSVLFWGVKDEVGILLNLAGLDTALLDSLPDDERIFERIVKIYGRQIDKDILYFACVRGIVRGLNDPHSAFMTPENYHDFLTGTKSLRSSVGLQIGKDAAGKGDIIVRRVFARSPADLAGLRVGDRIVAVNGKSLENIEFIGVCEMITGPENSKVFLRVERDGKSKNFRLRRKESVNPPIRGFILKNRIGYIKIEVFTHDIAKHFQVLYSGLEKRNIKALILDLRDNPGGLLTSAQKICGCFLPGDAVVARLERRGGKKIIRSLGRRVVYVPVVVLVNSKSASCAEMVAAALKENKAAALVGEITKGKGSIQETTPLSCGAALKLTVERIYSPGGEEINLKGVRSDFIILESKEDKNCHPEKDAVLEKAEKILRVK